MPLIKKSSKKAFEHNIKAEVHAGKPVKQSLAIAFDIQRHNKKKKMASGGIVKGQEDDGEPKGMKPGAKDSYSSPAMREYMAGQMPKGSDTEQNSDEHAIPKEEYHGERYAHGGKIEDVEKEDEAHLMSSFPPGSPKMQPQGAYNEEHEKMTSGPMDEANPHTGETEEDMLRRHADEKAAFYRGGPVSDPKDYMGDEESEDEHPASIAEAIMMRKKFADGGMVSSDSNEEGPGTRRDFNIAAKKENYSDSDENFSYSQDGEDGDSRESEEENDHDEDMISKIRKKMRG